MTENRYSTKDIPYNVSELHEKQFEPSNLMLCAREYMAIKPEYRIPRFAQTQCWEASTGFLRLLRIRGVVTDQMVRSREARTHTRIHGTQTHTDVRIGRIVIDWTARQFDPNAAFPLVYLLGEGYEELETKQTRDLRGLR